MSEGGTGAPEGMPDMAADFSQIIQAFGVQVLLTCGNVENPITGKKEKDLTLAKYHIGVLEILREKTKGNLSPDESGALEDILHHARMAFLEAGGIIPK